MPVAGVALPGMGIQEPVRLASVAILVLSRSRNLLEATAAQRASLHIDSWSEQNMCTFGDALLAHHHTDFV